MKRLREARSAAAGRSAAVRQAARSPRCSAPASCRSRCRDRARCCSRAMPARAAMSSERAKNAFTSAMMSMRGSARLAIVHDDHRHAVLGDDARHVGIALQPHTSLTIAAPCSSAHAATFAFMVSIETGTPSADDLRQHRREPRELVVERDRLRAAIGPRGLRADVEMSAPSAAIRRACAIATLRDR